MKAPIILCEKKQMKVKVSVYCNGYSVGKSVFPKAKLEVQFI